MDVNAVYNGSVPINILKFPGVELCSLGITVPPENDKTYDEILFIDRANRYYKKCIVHNDKLVGAILLGDKSEFREFRDLIQQQTELSERRLTLLRSGKPAEPVKGKLVCSCNNVGSGNIFDAIKGGITMLDELCNHTGAGTGCGSCKPEVKALLSARLEKEATVAAEFQ